MAFARTFHGIKDRINNAEQVLFDRWEGTTTMTTKGVRADEDKFFADLITAASAIDGLLYAKMYLCILTIKD